MGDTIARTYTCVGYPTCAYGLPSSVNLSETLMTTASSSAPWTEERVRALGLHTDVATAASILGIGRSTAYDLIRRGTFPVRVVRVGSRIRVPVAPLADAFGTGVA